jgi:Fe-S-cluster containining protein
MTTDTPLPWPARGQTDPGDDPAAVAEMAAMADALRAMLALPGLEEFRTTRTLPAEFFSHWAAALAAYDRYVAHLLATDGRPVTCQAGCATCCRHELARGVTGVELLAIYRHVRPWSDIGALYEAAGENAVAFQRVLHAEVKQTGEPLVAEDPRVFQAHLAYNRLERPCAFLDDAAGLCRIYPVRPLVCRWFHNRSPAAWCAPDHPDYLARDALGIDPDREVNDLIADLDRRLGLSLVNYLAGAFVQLGGDVLGGAPVRVV